MSQKMSRALTENKYLVGLKSGSMSITEAPELYENICKAAFLLLDSNRSEIRDVKWGDGKISILFYRSLTVQFSRLPLFD